jgi:uncharacterized membrane protein
LARLAAQRFSLNASRRAHAIRHGVRLSREAVGCSRRTWTRRAGAAPIAESPADTYTNASKNVRTVARVEREALHRRSVIERLSDAIARAAGSSTSLLVYVLFFTGWLLLNAGSIPRLAAFDPFPFGLLTPIVSLEAIFLSSFILISQKRMSRQVERREHLDLQISLLAEQESTVTLRLLRRLCERVGVDVQAFDQEMRDLAKSIGLTISRKPCTMSWNWMPTSARIIASSARLESA